MKRATKTDHFRPLSYDESFLLYSFVLFGFFAIPLGLSHPPFFFGESLWASYFFGGLHEPLGLSFSLKMLKQIPWIVFSCVCCERGVTGDNYIYFPRWYYSIYLILVIPFPSSMHVITAVRQSCPAVTLPYCTTYRWDCNDHKLRNSCGEDGIVILKRLLQDIADQSPLQIRIAKAESF